MNDVNERQGLRNQRAGKLWQARCAEWLRGHGWPSAGVETRNWHSDLIGTGDVAVECTIVSWPKVWEKLAQAQRDCATRGLEVWCVWKKHTGVSDPGAGAVIMLAEVLFPLLVRLERLEHAELEAAEAYDRGYRNGQQAIKDLMR